MGRILIPDIAKLLDVELDEEFKIRSCGSKENEPGVYKLTLGEGLVKKNEKGVFDSNSSIEFEDLMTLADGCILNCYLCPQGDLVKKCPRRLALHRLGLQCAQSRQDPKKGECEWRYEDSIQAISPQYKSETDLVPEQLP